MVIDSHAISNSAFELPLNNGSEFCLNMKIHHQLLRRWAENDQDNHRIIDPLSRSCSSYSEHFLAGNKRRNCWLRPVEEITTLFLDIELSRRTIWTDKLDVYGSRFRIPYEIITFKATESLAKVKDSDIYSEASQLSVEVKKIQSEVDKINYLHPWRFPPSFPV